MNINSLTIYSDGGARGNPGPAASAFVIIDQKGLTLKEQGFYIGNTTNNVAEYQGLIFALEWLVSIIKSENFDHILFKLDSLLIVNQLKGLYKVKEVHLQKLYQQTQELLRSLHTSYTFSHIPRSLNSRADYLVNQTLNSL